ncbi:carbohydrate porin [Massilia sp. R2A-15]|uniref:carbohydrate porin n=1 Tax=Massilia sp. R2A-15 TaxID=3064278 RepID=UPI002732D3F2|nr:carbohydrate porin [Massilia sp. R2A-15]WLI91168.1 carbohydrate porin [Massilia sp. R2A-15]
MRICIHLRAAAPFLFSLLALAAPDGARADEEQWNAKFQSTYIWQHKDAFSSPYTGVNSLAPAAEKSYSFTATAAFGFRPWAGAELYIDPELAQGVPLSHLAGLGGMTNGEMARTSGANPTFYRARAFLRQVWGLGGGSTQVESAANQLAGFTDRRRLTLTAGNLAVVDLFDNNAYSHDARTQFMNWSLISYGAYDFAADSRGYTWGATIEYVDGDWSLRAGRFVQPRESNGLALDPKIFRRYGDQVELEHRHEGGAVRLLVFRNVANMGTYTDALALGAPPAVAGVRSRHAKIGVGASVEQALTAQAGVFARASWADGKTETYAFAEIDRSMSAGALVKGAGWSRPADTAGVALARNGLSAPHIAYLAAGGAGFFLGDGRITYRPEVVGECFYNLALRDGAHFGLNLQRIANPAYNRDRGPVTVASVRLHAEF